MAKQKTIKEQNNPVEGDQSIINQSEANNDIENTLEISQRVKEDNNTPDTIIRDTIEEKINNTINDNSNKVRRIIQKKPSHYKLLMEDGRQIVLHKSLFDKKNMIVK